MQRSSSPFSPEFLREARDALASALIDREHIQMVVTDADLNQADIDWQGSPRILWDRVLEQAVRNDDRALLRLLETALKEAPGNSALEALLYRAEATLEDKSETEIEGDGRANENENLKSAQPEPSRARRQKLDAEGPTLSFGRKKKPFKTEQQVAPPESIEQSFDDEDVELAAPVEPDVYDGAEQAEAAIRDFETEELPVSKHRVSAGKLENTEPDQQTFQALVDEFLQEQSSEEGVGALTEDTLSEARLGATATRDSKKANEALGMRKAESRPESPIAGISKEKAPSGPSTSHSSPASSAQEEVPLGAGTAHSSPASSAQEEVPLGAKTAQSSPARSAGEGVPLGAKTAHSSTASSAQEGVPLGAKTAQSSTASSAKEEVPLGAGTAHSSTASSAKEEVPLGAKKAQSSPARSAGEGVPLGAATARSSSSMAPPPQPSPMAPSPQPPPPRESEAQPSLQATPEPIRDDSADQHGSVKFHGEVDLPTADDRLGFEPYAAAVADFLTAADTHPPLAMSIEGLWGTGKSSFMLMLKELITSERKSRWSREASADVSGSRKTRWWKRGMEKAPDSATDRGQKAASSSVLHSEGRDSAQSRGGGPSGKPNSDSRACKKPRYTVEFNAWRLDEKESMWAALALEVMQQIPKQRRPGAGIWARALLWLKRFDREEFLADIARNLLIVLILFVSMGLLFVLYERWPEVGREGMVALFTSQDGTIDLSNFLAKFSGGGALSFYLWLAYVLAPKLKALLGNPFRFKADGYHYAPAYASHLPFLQHFHTDFKRVVEAYAGDARVYIFIDDLDRCDVPTAADLMQAISMMVASAPPLFFIIGMDRQKVAAGLAAKYKQLVPYLSSIDYGPGGSNQDPVQKALSYGYEFVEKFVQLSFQLPQPGPEQLLGLLYATREEEPLDASWMPPSRTEWMPPSRTEWRPPSRTEELTRREANPQANFSASKTERTGPTMTSSSTRSSPKEEQDFHSTSTSRTNAGAPRTGESPTPSSGTQRHSAVLASVPSQKSESPTPSSDAQRPMTDQPTARESARRQRFELSLDRDSAAFREVQGLVARVLEYNPRRIKLFVNAFRLNALIAYNVGLFDPREGTERRTPLNFYKLGKYLALSIRWPLFTGQLEFYPDLLRELEAAAFEEKLEPENAAVFAAWAGDAALLELLRTGCLDKNGNMDPALRRAKGLGQMNVYTLLRISAPSLRPDERAA